MRLTAWQRFLSGSLAALVLSAPVAAPLAQNLVSPPSTAAPISLNPAPAIAIPAPAAPKVTAQPANRKPPVNKVAAKKKPVPKVAVAKKPAPGFAATKQQSVPATVDVAAARPAPPSYTITTTSGNVTATRIVPIPTASAAADKRVASTTTPAPPLVHPTSGAPLAQLAALTTPVVHPAPVTPAAQLAALTKDTAPSDAVVAASHTPSSTAAVGFVSAFLNKAFHIARDSDLSSLQRRTALAELFGAKMDVGRIAGYATGDELTAEPSDFQRRFRAILISYLVETYYPRLELASDPSVSVETLPGARMPDGSTVVWTIFTKSGFAPQSVKWQLVPTSDGYQIVDIFSTGASLVQMERDTFLSVMRDGGLPELMAKLDARTKALAGAATQ